jgi:hypothetical protein
MAGESTQRESPALETERSRDATAPGTSQRKRWARLLQRVFDIDGLRCPRCGSTLRLLAAIEDPAVAHKILECLGLPARAPPLEPTASDDGGPSEEEAACEFDQTPTYKEP